MAKPSLLPDLGIHVRINADGRVELLEDVSAREYLPLLDARADAAGEPRPHAVRARWTTPPPRRVVLSPDACSALDPPKEP